MAYLLVDGTGNVLYHTTLTKADKVKNLQLNVLDVSDDIKSTMLSSIEDEYTKYIEYAGDIPVYSQDNFEYLKLVDNKLLVLVDEVQYNNKLKELKQAAKSALTVTTQSGKVFDGNESARNNMLSAIQAGSFLNQESSYWKLADNTVVEVAIEELQEALTLSIQKCGSIVTATSLEYLRSLNDSTVSVL